MNSRNEDMAERCAFVVLTWVLLATFYIAFCSVFTLRVNTVAVVTGGSFGLSCLALMIVVGLEQLTNKRLLRVALFCLFALWILAICWLFLVFKGRLLIEV